MRVCSDVGVEQQELRKRMLWAMAAILLACGVAACGDADDEPPLSDTTEQAEETDQNDPLPEVEELPDDLVEGASEPDTTLSQSQSQSQNQASFPGQQSPTQGKIALKGKGPMQGGGKDKGKGVQQGGVGQSGVAQGGVGQGPQQTYKGLPKGKGKGVQQGGVWQDSGGKAEPGKKGKGVQQGGVQQGPGQAKLGKASPQQGGAKDLKGSKHLTAQETSQAPATQRTRPAAVGVSCAQNINHRIVVAGEHYILNRYVTAFYGDETALNDGGSSGFKDLVTIVFGDLFEVSEANLGKWVVQNGQLLPPQRLSFGGEALHYGDTAVASVVPGYYSVSRHSPQGESRDTKFDLAPYGACLGLYQSSSGAFLGDQSLVLVLP